MIFHVTYISASREIEELFWFSELKYFRSVSRAIIRALQTWQRSGLGRRRIGSRRTMSSMLMYSCTFRAGGDANITTTVRHVRRYSMLSHVKGIIPIPSQKATGREGERKREEREREDELRVRELEREVRGTDFPGAPT